MNLDPARRYALKLRSLQSADREWVLAQLEPVARARLLPLLDELEDLGLQVNQHLLESLSESSSGASAALSSDENVHRRNLRLLDRVDPQWVDETLEGEPDAIRSVLEGAHDWSWLSGQRGVGKYAVPSSRSPNVAHHLGPTPRVRAELVALMVRKLQADEQSGRGNVFAVGASASEAARKPIANTRRWLKWPR